VADSERGDFSTTVRITVSGDTLRDPDRFDKFIIDNELVAVRLDLEAWIRAERRAWLDVHG
jgi:hypothetical protein